MLKFRIKFQNLRIDLRHYKLIEESLFDNLKTFFILSSQKKNIYTKFIYIYIK